MKNSALQHKESIRDYYENILKSAKDLKTTACRTIDNLPLYIRDILSGLDSEILEKFYGCGSPIPFALGGMSVSDLGCGSGRDVYAISNRVINLSPDKPAVFKEIFRILKEKGELYFANVFADRRIPEELRHDPCVADTFLAAADFMNGGMAQPWWAFTPRRKLFLNSCEEKTNAK